MQNLLIDTDPGTDDAIALLMALNAPDARILGVTTAGGNASLAHTTKNVLAVLEHMGRTQVPVAKGASHPQAGGQYRYGYDFHGHRGIGVHFPHASNVVAQQDAAGFMERILTASAEPVTLLALAPLTNVAHLLQRAPLAARRIARLLVMGGALEKGNVTPYAEFNFYNDPEAAALVLASGLPVTLVPLETCAQVMLNVKDLARWRDADAPAARLADRILYKWFQRQPGHRLYDPCDPLALAVALAPAIASYEVGAVTVDTSQSETRGRMEFRPGPGPVSVAKQVDVAAFHSLLDTLLLKT